MSFNAKNLAYAKKDDVDDDEPTYVDEGSNEVISKEEYEALLRGDGKQQDSSEQHSGDQGQATSSDHASRHDTEKPDVEGASSKQNLAGIGGPKKRKQAKVVADDSVEAENDTPQENTGPQKAKQKQKKKKIKLSFDE
ncbi:DUF4604 domain-containing protein [Aspergillus thermomutatus]|uniref:DUF4604 domain-containing protein n=1 Tax=Aspergillus thermomutatus TaxID=41047 RepID=A0A397HY53_ASPTH|nr:uncharacterized protein CDV56_104322 [Aspergillus thermomutatus]RHZ66476.1 hypothetical protein CDV56_104322 [Aspergillus thermomutatus]